MQHIALFAFTVHHQTMERKISMRSLLTDKKRDTLIQLGREKERELIKYGVIHSLLFSDLLIAPALENKKLGYFSSSDKLIVLSEEMVMTSDEITIKNIFLHELSHALDFAMHGTLSGHSALFHQCCRVLGVPPEFEKSKIKANARNAEEQRDRIKKLLALSSSPFENEAQEAIKKAKALMAKAGITETDHEEKIYMVPLYAAKRYLFSVRTLLNYVATTTGVYIVISSEKDSTKKAIAYGSLEETEGAIYLFDYLTSAAERELSKLRKMNRSVEKDSFIRGMIKELSEHTADSSSDKALVIIRDKNRKLAKKIVFHDTRISERVVHTNHWNPKSFEEGRNFGSKLNIPRRIERKELE